MTNPKTSPIAVRTDSGTTYYREKLNIVAGTNMTINPTWGDSPSDEVTIELVSSGGGGGAPTDAQYLVATSNGTLSAERVTTNTTTVTWDHGTAGQAKANVDPSGIKLDDLAAPDDNTDLNASTSAHGLLRKLSNVATEYLDGTGAWSTPAGGSGLTQPQVMARAFGGC